MPMVIAAANKARSVPKVPTISVVDDYAEQVISSDKNNGKIAVESKTSNSGNARCGLMQVAVAVAKQPTTPKGSPKENNAHRF